MKQVILGVLMLSLVACGTGIKNMNFETKEGQKLGCVATENDSQICRVDDGKGNVIEMEIAMKRIIDTVDGGLDAMLGEKVCIFCSVYIYTGVLAGVNEDHIELDEARIVYETGSLDAGEWTDSQSLPGTWRVQISHVESWGPAKC